MASGRPFILLDVREPFEFEMARIEGANLIPLGELPARWQELDREKEIFVFCHSGMRSAAGGGVFALGGICKSCKCRGWHRRVVAGD